MGDATLGLGASVAWGLLFKCLVGQKRMLSSIIKKRGNLQLLLPPFVHAGIQNLKELAQLGIHLLLAQIII